MSEPLNKTGQENPVCPRCRQPAPAVSAVTVAAMLKPEKGRQRTHPGGFRFCATQDCDVAYFKPGSDEAVLQHEVRIPIFQKSSSPTRLVCYCFGHSVESVENRVRAKASSDILDEIKAKCAQGLAACERNNPQGSCCLANVQRLMREVRTTTMLRTSGGCGCCGDD